MEKYLEDELPGDRVECLRQVEFEKDCWGETGMQLPCRLVYKHEIIVDATILDEGTLFLDPGDQVGQLRSTQTTSKRKAASRKGQREQRVNARLQEERRKDMAFAESIWTFMPGKKGSVVQGPNTRTLTNAHDGILDDINCAQIAGKHVGDHSNCANVIKQTTILENQFGLPSLVDKATANTTNLVASASSSMTPDEIGEGKNNPDEVFVCICGEKLLFHTNFNTTAVKELVVFALQRRNIKYCDIYVTWCGKVLKGDEILSSIPIHTNTHIHVTPRLRGGELIPMEYERMDELIDRAVRDNNNDLFYYVNLPPELINPYKDTWVSLQAAEAAVSQNLEFLLPTIMMLMPVYSGPHHWNNDFMEM
nr:putative zinc finger CCCH domain-containing protein 64 [Oryza sativa Japonica Group]